MGYFLTILGAYLMGSSSMSYYLSRLKGVDIRHEGSGNLGASNTMVLLGWKAGILVGAHDIGKAVLAVILARTLFPQLPNIEALAGVSCILGHMFPFYLGFRGGKGFACYLGMTLAMNWKFSLLLMVLVVVVTVVTDYIVTGTTLTILATPICMGICEQSLLLGLILCIPSLIMLVQHRENYVRIWKGTEVGLRGASKGEHRIK